MTKITNSTAIVLGAAGFVGRHVCRALSAHGYTVLGVGHGTWIESEWRECGISKWLAADIDLDSLDHLTNGIQPQFIVHCGGSGTVSYSYTYPLADFQRATHSTALALEWIRLNYPDTCRLVLVSSAAVYGDQGDTNATENSMKSPISPYGVNKVAAESLCESYSRFFGTSCSIVRLFSVYGEGLRKQLLWDALNKFKCNQYEFFGTGNELRDWIHVVDAAELVVKAATSEQSKFEVYNGGFEHATTRDLLNLLAKVSNNSNKLIFNGEMHQGNPRRLTSDCRQTMRLLQWKPQIILEVGIKRYELWYRLQQK
jgi:UDP-glucose 4-epimerase